MSQKRSRGAVYRDRARSKSRQKNAVPRLGRTLRLGMEWLEPRRMLTSSPIIISEIEAANSSGIVDSAGVAADWLEITNTSSTQTVNLANWKLEYNTAPTIWTFPSMNLGPGESRVIFCDSASATDPTQELHTNFNLSKSGKNLLLVDNLGNTIQSFTPFPAMTSDISYGVGETVSETDLVAAGATAKYFAPTNGTLNTTWTQPGFNDSSWASGPTGLGYAVVNGFATTLYKANTGSVANLAQANAVISTPSQQTSTFSQTSSVLNFLDTGGDGHFGNDSPFPGMTINQGLSYYVLQATGTLTISASQAGFYAFGANSDDGFSLNITGASFGNGVNTTTASGATMASDKLQGPTDTFATTFLAAGTYPFSLVFYQNAGGSEFELSAAKAPTSSGYTSFNTNFHLVGDTANGGLTVTSVPFSGNGGTSASPLAAAIKTNVKSAVQSAIQTAGATSLYSRITFNVANLAALQSLTLRMQYSSGYVAYLNGVQIASSNAPASPVWNSVALEYRTSAVQATTYEDVDITSFLNSSATGHLTATGNVLAIQTLMKSPTDASLFVQPEIAQISIAQSGLHFFAKATPGTPNIPSTWQPDLTFSAQHGFYSSPFQLLLTTTTPGATIRYTTNNSTPSATNGTVYSGPITISTTTTVRAVSLVTGGQSGVVSTESYIFLASVINQSANPAGFPALWGEDTNGNPQTSNYGMNPQITQNPLYAATLEQDLLSLPTVSIVSDIPNIFDGTQSQTTNTGIYTNETNLVQGSVGGVPLQMEAPASLEYFDPSGAKSLQINMGLQMEGGVGRYPQFQLHNFRMQFSTDYGPSSLDYPLFPGDPVTSFKNIDLKAGFNDAWSWSGSGSPPGNAAQYMRDVFAANTQLAMGQPGYHSQYVFLYVDGLFWGVYEMMERPDANFAASYLGGSSSDWEANNAGHEVNGASTNLPMWNALQSFPSSNTMTTVAAFEKVQGNNANGTPNAGYTDLLDMTNYIDYMLMNFYIGNTDWPWHNFYAAIDAASPDGFKFFNWDGEMSLGLINGGFNSNVNVNVLGPSYGNGNGVATLYSSMYSNPEFDMAFADQARQFLFNGGALTPSATIARYQSQISTIQAAMIAESARWGTIPTSPGPLPNTQAAWLNEANYITGTYMPQRTGILLSQLQAAGLYPNIIAPEFYVNGVDEYGGNFNPGNQLTISAAGPPAGAVIYYTLDGTDPRLIGGAVNSSSSVHIYTGPIILQQGTQVRARVYSGGTWSAISQAAFTVNLQSIRISELMYSPTPATPAEVAAGYTSVDGAQDFEFIEIKNTGAQTLPLQGLQFTNGVTFAFPNVSIAPGAYTVVVSDAAAFAIRYGAELQAQFGANWQSLIVAGQYTGHLSNGGVEVQLTAPNGGVLADFTYSPDWYPQTDGGGFSLTARDVLEANSLLSSSAGWEPSGGPGGSPGTAETFAIPLPGSIVVNEVLANPLVAGGDLIELANTTSQPINIGGWWLSDSTTNLTKYQIAAGTTIAAGGYLVLSDAKNYGAGSGDPGAHTPFVLSKYGFSVCMSSNAGGVAGGYQAQQAFGASPAGISAGLLANSMGSTSFVLLSTPTFGLGPNYVGGANNTTAYVSPVVMSELMYDPAQPTAAETAAGFTDGDDFEFVELFNRSNLPQSLANYYIGSGVGFTFGWYADGLPSETWTLESGATATWATSALGAGTYTVYADYSLTDQNGKIQSADSAAQYSITYPGGSQLVTVDQNTAAGGQLALGSITTTGAGQIQVQLLRTTTAKPSQRTIASQVEFVKTGTDLHVGSPALTSFATQSGLMTLAPGNYAVLVSDYAAFDFRYHVAANHIPVVGTYSGSLDNAGEAVALFQTGTPDGVTGFVPYFQSDLVDYANSAPWPTEAAGGGPSLMRLRAADYANDPDNWIASNGGGTPGVGNLAIDRLAPTTPTNLAGVPSISPNKITLSWTASTDTRSGVDHYVVYRDGVSIGTSLTTSYADTSILTATNYSYSVAAVNRDGYASDQSTAIVAAVPGVASYDWIDNQHIEVYFNEPLTTGPASTLSNYAMTGGLTFAGVTLSRDNTKITLATNQAATTGTHYTLMMTNLTAVSGHPLPASLPLSVTYQPPTGSILLQVWSNLDGGTAVSDLTNPALNPNYPNNPTSSSYLTSFDAPFNTGQVDYGERIEGYIYPPTTGSYTFWIASDDNSQLWLSTDTNPNNAVQIASVGSYTNYHQWNAYASQQSTPISLVAGQRYFIMALMKQGVGGDNLSVAWQPPGTTFDTTNGTSIPGTYLAPFALNADLTPPAAPANLRATLTGSNTQVTLNWSPVTDLTSGVDHYVIYRDGQAYATSTTASYTDTSNISSLNRHTYQVAAVNFDGVTGAQSTVLSVAPVGVASIGTPTTSSVAVVFTEPVDPASAQVATNYQISGASISSAVLQSDGVTVVLSTSALGSGSQSLSVNNVHTRTGASVPAFSGNFTYTSSAWTVTAYEANGNISGSLSSLAQAQSVIATPANQAWVRTAAPQFINYATGGAGQGEFTADNGIPGQLVTDNVVNYVLTATGQIFIPAAGTYTFDCDSDDGFSVTIQGANFISGTNDTSVGGSSFAYDGNRGSTDSLGVATFPAAGYYPISLLFYQGAGPSGVELSAAVGSQSAFNASLFHLVGDTANGGLALGGAATPAPFTVAVTPLATNDPTPAISGTVSTPSTNLTIRVNGVYYAVANNNGAWTLPDGAIAPPLAGGTYDVLAAASNSGGQAAFDTTQGELTIDTAGPTATLGPVVPSTRVTPLGSIPIHFSEPVSGLSLRNLQLTIGGLSAPLLGATLTTADNQNWTLGNLSGLTYADGNYQLSLIPADWNMTDSAGTSLSTTATASWTMAAGTLIGNPANNVYRIVVDSVDPSKADVFINNSTSTPTYTVTIAGLSQWTLNAVAGDQLIVDFSNGNPLPAGGVAYTGLPGGNNGLTIVGTSAADNVTGTVTQITVNGAAPINYSNIATFQFPLGAGQDNLSLNGATMRIVNGLDDAGALVANAGSNITVDHVNEGALVIGGTAGSPAVVTIAASDASGNPLAGSAAAENASAVGASSVSPVALTDAPSSSSSGSALAGATAPSTTVSDKSFRGSADFPMVGQGLGSVFAASGSPRASTVDDQSHSVSQVQSHVDRPSHPLIGAVLAEDIVAGSRWLQWAGDGERHADEWTIAGDLEHVFELLATDVK